jgi:hypothetical protein
VKLTRNQGVGLVETQGFESIGLFHCCQVMGVAILLLPDDAFAHSDGDVGHVGIRCSTDQWLFRSIGGEDVGVFSIVSGG